MDIQIGETKEKMGLAAAQMTGEAIREAITAKGYANIILATGASQFEMLNSLIAFEGIDWSKVTMFHLDEYIGIDISHPASFRKYLKERFVDLVGELKAFHLIAGDTGSPESECERVGDLIKQAPIDVACVGIGENGHLAFNDPPADFETDTPYLVVNLDQKCREQQMGEGWFKTMDDVPAQAISMSINQIMKSKKIVVTVPDQRKAEAVVNTLNREISPEYPASILREHPQCVFFLDKPAASMLS
ncbi:MAG: glucosamine-6-phosphate deaminase [Kiritimatiellae bacterium]|jgi:glucosamine-6-phosphate deaminase|nr:glucosamine-6-phosphate deaminase [Kiritimatiellia bacterium]